MYVWTAVILGIFYQVWQYRWMNTMYFRNKMLQQANSEGNVTCYMLVCQMSLCLMEIRGWSEKISLINVCEVSCGGLCVQQIALRSCLTFPLTALNFSQCQDCQIERRRGRGRRGEKREGKTTSEGRVRARILSVRLRVKEGTCPCAFWHSKVSACPPIITWWCVMKVRSVCLCSETMSVVLHRKPDWYRLDMGTEAKPKHLHNFLYTRIFH